MVSTVFTVTKISHHTKGCRHTFTTEAIANLFGRFATNPQWMFNMGIIDAKEREKIADESHKALRLQMIVFSRWAQVMYRFEKQCMKTRIRILTSSGGSW